MRGYGQQVYRSERGVFSGPGAGDGLALKRSCAQNGNSRFCFHVHLFLYACLTAPQRTGHTHTGPRCAKQHNACYQPPPAFEASPESGGLERRNGEPAQAHLGRLIIHSRLHGNAHLVRLGVGSGSGSGCVAVVLCSLGVG